MSNKLWIYEDMNQGSARRLRGQVLIELVFVSDRQTTWMQNETDQFYGVYRNALEGLRKQAVAAGVPLSFSTVVGKINYQGTVALESNRSAAVERVFRQYLKAQGFDSDRDYLQSRKQANGADEVAAVLVMEKGFRAFACPDSNMEFCALCQTDNEHAIAHELLHLFGAVDLYYPYQVYGLTMSCFPETVMCTWEGMEVDPLTQYLVGWTEEMPPKVQEFLDKLRDFTWDRYCQANILELYRGNEDILLQRAKPFGTVMDIGVWMLQADPWAEYLHGLCYLHGIGVEKNECLAERCFARSGRTGLIIAGAAHAQLLLSRGISTEQDRENLWLLLIYNNYDHQKLLSLKIGCMLSGVGGKKNLQGAVNAALSQYQDPQWYLRYTRRSAKLYAIAEKYSSEIPELHAVVQKLRMDYERILQQGDPDWQYVIGRLLEEGRYITGNLPAAVDYYQKSAHQGNRLACRELARCYRYGIGTPRDLSRAEYWEAQQARCRRDHPGDVFCKVMEA